MKHTALIATLLVLVSALGLAVLLVPRPAVDPGLLRPRPPLPT